MSGRDDRRWSAPLGEEADAWDRTAGLPPPIVAAGPLLLRPLLSLPPVSLPHRVVADLRVARHG